LHILHVYKDYHPVLGGIENHIKTLSECQVAAGHRVTVLVTNPAREPAMSELNGVQVKRVPRLATVASTPLSPTFPLALRAVQPDITHLHFPYPVGEISQFLAGRGRPYVITYHSDVVRQQTILRFYRPLLERVLHGAARIIPTSDRYVATSPFLRPLAAKCTAVPLAVDPVPFLEATPLFPRESKPTILFVGRHRYYKGVDDLLRAMPHINGRLLIAGDGPLTAQWQSLAVELSLGQKVRFLGTVSDEDLPRLYASADLFVLPANSRAEAFGKVLLEAMAAGLPCVTTEVGTGTSYVVQDGLSGFVVPPCNPQALSSAIQRLAVDAALRQKMGHAGRERVLKEFTPRLMEERIAQVYEAVLSDRRRL
jgi:rhamnosyl/mannosyltransferase